MKNLKKRGRGQKPESGLSSGNSKSSIKKKGLANDKQAMNSSYIISKYRVACCQSPGKERAHNEDTVFVLNSILGGLDSSIAFGIYLVADGMGGHQSGELASNLAAQGVSQYLMDQIQNNFLFEKKLFSQSEIERFLLDAVDEAQKLIMQRVPGGGTTLTLVVALGDDLYSAHVGDCRLFVIDENGKMSLKTRDHSLVKRLVDLGEISESEAENHPNRNVLYRAMGQSEPFKPDIEKFSIQPGERLMICSDGLWGVVDQQEMMQILKNQKDPEDIVCELVDAANAAGGPDNISVILVERLG